MPVSASNNCSNFCTPKFFPPISGDGDFVFCCLLSEMQHALKSRLLFYKWRYKYLLNDDVVVAVVVVVVIVVIKKATCTAQKMKFSIADFFSKCDQIRRKLQIWSHILKKSAMENFIFCVVMKVEFPNKINSLNPNF